MVINNRTRQLFLTVPLLLTMVSCGQTGNENNSSSSISSSGGITMKSDDRNLTPQDYALMNLCGEDAVGRKINRVDRLKAENRYVGLFYSVWLGQHEDAQHGIYNITYLEQTEEGRTALASETDSSLSRMGDFHFWGEPLYGYYNMRDPWVVTRHMELLTNAGVDYLCIDATNDKVYPAATENVLDVLLKYQQQGFNVPKVCFYTNSNSGDTVDKLYAQFYQTEKYNSIWFAPNGKPLIIGITKNNKTASDQTKYNPNFNKYISDEMCAFFDVKESEWPNGDQNDNSYPWMSWEYPQRIHNGTIAVPVAQHSHSRISVSYKDPECSRGYNNVTHKVEENFDEGRSFQDMWNTAFDEENNINNVICTSFNEWMAIKNRNGDGTFFVDVYDHEFSRDMEMMKGGYGDNFYLQLVENIRRFKYEEFVEYKKDSFNIDIENGVSPMWQIVNTAYADFAGDAMVRDFQGAIPSVHYNDNSARNDVTLVKVAHNEDMLYFYVECEDNITDYQAEDEGFMNIFIKTKQSDKEFMGFNYLINRRIKDNEASVEKCLGGYSFEEVGKAKVTINDNIMQVAIPRALIETNEKCDIEFKVTDNITHKDDIMDYYVSGESMPLGRMRYGY